ncbi:MAG: hypothetical protein K2P87_16500 [Lachnospiraceae bacterium]|nr:hypothetical protein [Lachnospiraceae bacterium]
MLDTEKPKVWQDMAVHPDAGSGNRMLQERAAQETEALERNAKMKGLLAQEPKKITELEVQKAVQILQKYKAGKERLEKKIVANEEFWKLRQWNYMNDGTSDFSPATPWLWSCIQSRYSDVMDSYPTCNIQPRQMDDKQEARKLSQIVPVVMAQNNYEETYSDIAWYTLKHGGGVHGVFWDGSRHNGLGDISIRKVDFINLFWEPGITDIQKSENLFHTELVSKHLLEQRYPQCKGKLGGSRVTLTKYLYDDAVDTTDKAVVVDWYYHTEHEGRRALQFVKFVDGVVLYATENDTIVPSRIEADPQTGIPVEVATGEPMAVRGLYDHAKYPFVVQQLFPVEGSICGYGLTDIGRDTQIQIDKLNKAIVDNAVTGATPRYFVKADGSVNLEEYQNTEKPFVHVEGSIGEENIRPIDTKQLDAIYVNILNSKVEELKYCTSNQDANNGVAPSGITAASAIAALQETAGKNARSANKTFHRAYREVVYQVVELIRQFYDVPRTFRICSDLGEEFVQYSNEGIVAQRQQLMGMDTGLRLPEFDIDVTTEKANPYKKMEINELALSFYGNGFFNPAMADQAVACLQMMDFTHKDEIMRRIMQNGTLQQKLLEYQQLALQLAQRLDPALAGQIGQAILAQGGGTFPEGGQLSHVAVLGEAAEHPFVERARSDARNSTQDN